MRWALPRFWWGRQREAIAWCSRSRPPTGTWTATANATWLHLSLANQSGTGSTNVVFTYDANPGATRSGTLTIASQTLTVTQAGSTYVAARLVTTLVSSGLNGPFGVAVDGAGNVYIADTGNNAIKEWTAANNTVPRLVSSDLNQSQWRGSGRRGQCLHRRHRQHAIKEWTAANSNVTTLVSSGSEPSSRRGGGRRGQCLYRRHRQQSRSRSGRRPTAT